MRGEGYSGADVGMDRALKPSFPVVGDGRWGALLVPRALPQPTLGNCALMGLDYGGAGMGLCCGGGPACWGALLVPRALPQPTDL